MLRRHSRAALCAATCLVATVAVAETDPPVEASVQEARAGSGDESQAGSAIGPADRLLRELDPRLRPIVAEALERNPELEALAAEAEAARLRVPQSRALPNPSIDVTAYLLPPETRVGPSRFMASFDQPLPAGGKRGAAEAASEERARAATARWQAERLKLVTRMRAASHELAFLEEHHSVLHHLRGHLVQHEAIARERYATGAGLAQSVVKIQAEITDVDFQLLDFELRRVQLRQSLNRWRDREPDAALPRFDLADAEVSQADLESLAVETLIRQAELSRPEVAAADAEIRASEALIVLSEKIGKPDWSVGATYTLVDRRDDPAGVALPPADNGNDVFGLKARVVLPIRRASNESHRDEARQRNQAALRRREAAVAEIRSSVAERALRLPLLWRQYRLVEDLLVVQAEEALDSARSAYVTGQLNALDLLHAEHVLFDARIAAARARADHLISRAELEGAVGEPLGSLLKEEME